MSEDRGDELSDANKEFLLYQNAMAELGAELHSHWWELIQRGFKPDEYLYLENKECINAFDLWAANGDPMAIALLTKVMELRLRG